MNQHDLVSVVIPTYNRWPIVGDAIRSALDQAGPVEVVVVDDGSTDGSADEIATAFPSVRLLRGSNRERGAARNAGAAAATGRWLAFLDSDDVLEPWHMTTVWPHLTDAVDAVYTRASLWDATTGRQWPFDASPRDRLDVADALWGNPIAICCLVVDRAVFESLGGFCEERAVAGSEDWLFNLRLIARCNLLALDVRTARVRDHDERSMADPDSMIASRRAATEAVVTTAAAELGLTADQLRRVRAGTERFAASHWYAAGEMRRARRCLRAVRRELGFWHGWRVTARLWLQSLLGRAAAEALRRARRRVRRRGRDLTTL